MNKRQFLASSLSAAVGAASFSAVSRTLMAQESDVRATNPATFVLVHGAWCGGFVYRQVADGLRARGHRVFSPSLTGLGDRSHLASADVDLTTHINDVVSLIRYEELSNVVLVGHSFGGLVISGVARSEAERIDSIVYLDAFLPGFFALEGLGPMPRNSTNTLPMPEGFSEPFGIPDEDLWKYSGHPIGAFLEAERFEFGDEWNSIAKKTYVLANRPPSFQAAFDSVASDPGWTTYAVDSRHMLMFDVPDRVIEILEEAA